MGREQRSSSGANVGKAGGPRKGLQRAELEWMGQLSLQVPSLPSSSSHFLPKKVIYGLVWTAKPNDISGQVVFEECATLASLKYEGDASGREGVGGC